MLIVVTGDSRKLKKRHSAFSIDHTRTALCSSAVTKYSTDGVNSTNLTPHCEGPKIYILPTVIPWANKTDQSPKAAPSRLQMRSQTSNLQGQTPGATLFASDFVVKAAETAYASNSVLSSAQLIQRAYSIHRRVLRSPSLGPRASGGRTVDWLADEGLPSLCWILSYLLLRWESPLWARKHRCCHQRFQQQLCWQTFRRKYNWLGLLNLSGGHL